MKKKTLFAALLLLQFCLPMAAGRIVTDTVRSQILSAEVPLNVYLLRCSGEWRDVLMGEVLVVVVECLWYYGFVRKWSQAAVYSLLCNAISFLTGVLFQLLLVFFNAGL